MRCDTLRGRHYLCHSGEPKRLRPSDRSDRSDTPRVVTGALADLAARVARLSPSHRDPERYHVEKSEIAAELRRLAREATHG